MKKIVVALPASHSWFWPQICLTALHRYPPRAEGYECQIVLVDNSWDWSPSIRGVKETKLGNGITIIDNPKALKFHGNGLDTIVEQFDCDLFMAMETDVIALRHGWLQWFVDMIRPTDFAVGIRRLDYADHYQDPSCTLYRASVLREMSGWSMANKENAMCWGGDFEHATPMPEQLRESISGPFSEKRGWPAGTRLKNNWNVQSPGYYEPGQALSHWAEEKGWTTYPIDISTTYDPARQASPPGLPTATLYGLGRAAPTRNLELHEMWGMAWTVHLWAGTRALDIIKHPTHEDWFISGNESFWWEREARFWLQTVDEDVREQTLGLIRKHGWHTTSWGSVQHPELRDTLWHGKWGAMPVELMTVTERDRAAVARVQEHYAKAGVVI